MSKQKIRNRITEYRLIPASEIEDNPKNFRTHPSEQREALTDIFEEVGIAGAALVRCLPNGHYQLIDGHLRRDILKNQEVPCIITDLDQMEADLVLATHDPLAAMAGCDGNRVGELLRSVSTSSQAISDLLTSLAEQARVIPPSPRGSSGDQEPAGVVTITQYTLVFDDEDQQANWFTFVKHLAERYPDVKNVGARVDRFVTDYMGEES